MGVRGKTLTKVRETGAVFMRITAMSPRVSLHCANGRYGINCPC